MDNQIDILDTIIFSKEFRRLEDKTQLFPASSGVHYRNRMTHTMEVLVIAKKIGKELNEIIKNDNFYNSQKVDEDLIEAIALAHDLGHTPFGHIGERTLNDILSRKDKLGIIEESSDDFKTSSFKHNINSGKILIQNFKDIDVKVIDGAIKHTFIFYNDFNDNGLLSIISINKCNEKFKNFGGEKIQYWKILYPITIEGQIVAIADEIAQRCADLDDTYRTRYLNKINNLIDYDNLNINSDYMKVSKESNLSQYDIVISKVKRILIEGVKESFKEIIRNNTNLNFEKLVNINIINYIGKIQKFDPNDFKTVSKNSFKHYKENINNARIERINSYNELESLNAYQKADKLDFDLSEIITVVLNSYNLRMSDSKSKQIIRQLFKAYLNNYKQLEDKEILSFCYDISDYLSNNQKLNQLIKEVKKFNEKAPGEKQANYSKIIKTHADNSISLLKLTKGCKQLNKSSKDNNWINFDVVDNLINFIKNNYLKSKEVNKLFNIFLNHIANYIASMTDTYAINKYHELYGI